MRHLLLIICLIATPLYAQQVDPLTAENWQESRAKQWGLSEQEWARYQHIIKGPRGLWTPDIDPILALGIDAKTDDRRKHYARLYLERERQRAEQELRFLRVYSELYDELYGDQPLLLGQSDQTWAITDRIALVVNQFCCNDLVRRALGTGHAVDLFVYGGTDQQIMEWLASFNVPAETVQSRLVTLNHAESQRDVLGTRVGVIYRNRSGVLDRMETLP